MSTNTPALQQTIQPVQMAMPTNAGNSALSIFTDAKTFETAQRMANCLASSTVIPKDYQKNIGNCLIAIEMASRINTSPMMVMQNLYIVNGRPSWSSQWIIAMINSSHRYKTELQFEFGHSELDGGLSCQAWAEDYSGHKVTGPKITMNMARDEGWLTKSGSKWKTMPEVMIQYRAAAFFGRMNCPDMIMGIYSAEEVYDMGDTPMVDGTGLVVDTDTGEVIETPIQEDAPISKEERQNLFSYAKEHYGTDANAVLKDILKSFGYESTNRLPHSVYSKVLEKISNSSSATTAEEEGSSADEYGDDEEGSEEYYIDEDAVEEE